MNKRIGITCLIILGSACLLTSIIVVGGVGVYMWDKANPMPTITAAPTYAIVPEVTTCPAGVCQESSTPNGALPTDSNTAAAIPTVELPNYIVKVMDQIQTEVVQIRGLQPRRKIPRTLLSSSDLRNKVVNDFLVDYTPEDAQNDAIVLSILGLLPPDFDLLSFYEELYNEQIAGYYDDETKEMYVVRSSGFGGPEKMTYSHEFTHVLQDQNYDLRNGLRVNDEDCEKESERCAAITALIEGDASLTEYDWLYQYASDQDRSEIQTFYQSYESPVYDSAPPFMQDDFLFPYTAGQEFVQVLFDQGGWHAINNAYANPPVSTEQIMHPSRYPFDTPIVISLPDVSSALGQGWVQTETNVIGEWYTYLVLAKGYQFETQIDDTLARTASEGWGGDAFQVYYNAATNQTVLVMKTTWDTSRDAKEFYDAFKLYGKTRWGSPSSHFNLYPWLMNLVHGVKMPDSETTWQTDTQSVEIRYNSHTTLVIIAPDSNTIDLIIQTLNVK